MNFIVENIDFFGFNKIVNFVMLNTALSLHTHTHTHTHTHGVSTTLNAR